MVVVILPFIHQYEAQVLDCGLEPLLSLAPARQGEPRTTLEGVGWGTGTVSDCSQEPLITFCHPAEGDIGVTPFYCIPAELAYKYL